MPKLPDEPLHKTNINLYERDVVDMKNLYGYGWSEVVRNLVRQHLNLKAKSFNEVQGGRNL